MKHAKKYRFYILDTHGTVNTLCHDHPRQSRFWSEVLSSISRLIRFVGLQKSWLYEDQNIRSFRKSQESWMKISNMICIGYYQISHRFLKVYGYGYVVWCVCVKQRCPIGFVAKKYATFFKQNVKYTPICSPRSQVFSQILLPGQSLFTPIWGSKCVNLVPKTSKFSDV